MTFNLNDVITLKLTSGDELIARFADQTVETITVSKVMTFMMGPQGLGLVPFIFSAAETDKITLPLSSVLVMVKTDKSVATQYQKQTSSLVI